MRPMGTVGSVRGLLEGLWKLRKKDENQNLRLAGYLPKRSLHVRNFKMRIWVPCIYRRIRESSECGKGGEIRKESSVNAGSL